MIVASQNLEALIGRGPSLARTYSEEPVPKPAKAEETERPSEWTSWSSLVVSEVQNIANSNKWWNEWKRFGCLLFSGFSGKHVGDSLTKAEDWFLKSKLRGWWGIFVLFPSIHSISGFSGKRHHSTPTGWVHGNSAWIRSWGRKEGTSSLLKVRHRHGAFRIGPEKMMRSFSQAKFFCFHPRWVGGWVWCV